MEKAIVERFLNKNVGLVILDNGREHFRKGVVVLVTEQSLILRYFDGRENAFSLDRIKEIKEVVNGAN